jgi:two-component system, chemotaxis family, protein-glutamate methylesterase/glutaminase
VPDHHLILADGTIRLGRGPRENMARPAIDPLFRSAAAAYGPRVIGLVLSGLLNDGSSGLEAIKRCGGLALVQDPADAIADEMPRNALSAVTADLIAPSARLGDVLSDLAREQAGPRLPVPPEIRLEVDIAAGERIDSEVLRRFADPVALTCPNCHGVLSRVRGAKPLRFRCQVGHALTADVVAKEQENAVDEALRVALRIIEERAELVSRMAEDGRASGRPAVAEMYGERAIEYRRYADTIRRAVLMSLPDYGVLPDAADEPD